MTLIYYRRHWSKVKRTEISPVGLLLQTNNGTHSSLKYYSRVVVYKYVLKYIYYYYHHHFNLCIFVIAGIKNEEYKYKYVQRKIKELQLLWLLLSFISKIDVRIARLAWCVHT